MPGALFLSLLTTVAGAQSVRVSGRVVRVEGERSYPLSGAWAVLHRLGPAGTGPLDSVRTDTRGAYQLLAQPDSTSDYVVGVRYAGVGYLTPSFTTQGVRARVLDSLVVYDSSSTQPIVLAQRHLLIQPPNPDGSTPVLELVILSNNGTRTRVSRDTVAPTWKMHLIRGATAAEIGESDLPHEVMEHEGDSLVVTGPITPGDKQIVLTYLLPRNRRELVVPMDDSTSLVGIMVADTLVGPPASLKSYGVTVFENIPYVRFEGSDIAAGTPVAFRLNPLPRTAGDLWWLVVAVTALAMVAALVAWSRGGRARAGLSHAELLALQIAAVDLALRDHDDPAQRRRRDDLAARLESVLAQANRGA